MKNFIIIIGTFLLFTSCNKNLDLLPLAQPSAEKWYSSETEIELALNDSYRPDWWKQDEFLDRGDQFLSDDVFFRATPSPIKLGTVTSQWSTSIDLWSLSYRTIGRVNRAIEALNRPETKSMVLKAKLDIYVAEAKFFRAAQYSRLITHFGDVVYSDEVIDLDSAYTIGRTDKAIILKKIYNDFDSAVAYLPKSYPAASIKRVTKGAALALKARVALYMGDFRIAADAAKACMDLGEYALATDYKTLFLPATKNSKEVIFSLPTSIALKVGNFPNTTNIITRTAGGFAAFNPTWDLFCSYLCKDGLPIDKSPLYDPRNPFKNRDPRCTATIVEFGTDHLGFTYDPNPTALKVLKTGTTTLVTNNDNRANAQFASFNGLVWKKGVDNSYLAPSTAEPDQIIIRYADVLLMYAEAKMELNEIDKSVLDALNTVRARAYGVALAATNLYPAVQTTVQSNLRREIRVERRVELAAEGLRYMDIVRWKIASKVLTRPIYGLLDPAELVTKVVNPGLWFFPGTPIIETDGTPDFSNMAATGLIKNIVNCTWVDRQYLWPIPTTEIQINPNMKQNPGY